MAEGPSRHLENENMGNQDEGAQAPFQGSLLGKMADLVDFLLSKYRRKETSTQAEMLREVFNNEQNHFPEIFSQARECLQLVFGIEMQENSQAHNYVLAPTLGLTYDGMTEAEDSKPKTGLLILVLGVILRGGGYASQEAVRAVLGVMGLFDRRGYSVFGEPWQLLTNEWVREQYLVYQQVPGSQPPRYEFLWGPRAHAETSKVRVRELWLRVINRYQYIGLPPAHRDGS
ncbi:melanoma-associated antigen 8-like [Erinaceus europaeus]|uniref:Melanoma-associated antigen 8-like n=1 Tax=Erinaceus europaeus TaxID=9365 RepID=A0ABM3WPU1_ERIEU|nr:melanoma-associated antigen 8-like [Erinaceus europaeus]